MAQDFTKLTDEAKDILLNEVYNLAFKYEMNYGNCTQCTLGAIKTTFEIIDSSLFKAAHGLSGGIGLTSIGTCGALVAGIMVISSIEGRDWSEFRYGDKPNSYKLSRNLINSFTEEYGGIKCHEVQERIMGRSYNLSNEDELEAFKAAGGFVDKCTSVVGNGAKFITEMILNGELKI